MIIIGIAGGTGSGKTTFVNKLIASLDKDSVAVISQDAYYRNNPELSENDRKQLNYDHPDAIEWELLLKHIHQLQNGETIDQPIYSMITCSREVATHPVKPNKVLIVEGILILTSEILRDVFSLKIFIDADADHRLMRVVKRDMEERGRNVDEVMKRYLTTVRPMHEQFIEPSKKFADIIVPVGGDNHVAIELLSQYITAKVASK
ncbi:MAG: uridine kinase [Bacteroidetes bacterium]|nr:uridine kinase [Bacteroidota bacterium]MBK7569158.1 uridine kinase [Bacteroidota bacterium]MBP8916913.1 uridine kinase [Chitinophagales bacterium]